MGSIPAALSTAASAWPDEPSDELSPDELERRIIGLAGRLAAATCEWLLLVARFDERGGCARWGLANTAHWLMHCCSLSRRTAFEHLRVARALAASPALAAEMRAGRLSYSQVRAITRVVTAADVRTTDDLVQAAQHCSIGQLEDVVRGMRTAERAEGPLVEPSESIRHAWGADSLWHLSSQLQPEHGALVESAIRSVARAEGLTQAEALVRMAEWALAAVADGGHPPRPLRGDERAAVVIHLDEARCADPSPPVDPARALGAKIAGRIAGGPGLSRPVLDRLLCAGRIRTVVHGRDGNLRDLGRSHRIVSDRQFRALLLRDHGRCTHPGCLSRARLQAHHVEHWIRGGRTDLDNLVLLCERHHHLLHDGDFEIVALGGQRFRFVGRDGRDLADLPKPYDLASGYEAVDVAHSGVADDAATTRWDGVRMDRHFAVSCFAEARARERAAADSGAGSPRGPMRGGRQEYDPWAQRPGSMPPADQQQTKPAA